MATFIAREPGGTSHTLKFFPATRSGAAHYETAEGFVVIQTGPDTFDIISGPRMVSVTADDRQANGRHGGG